MSMIQFRMKQIKVEQFAILAYIPLDNMEEMGLDTTMSVSRGTDIHTISVAIHFSFRYKDTQFMIIEVKCIFEIAEHSWNELNLNQTEQTELPDDFLGHLALHTVGTARGILFCKTEGTKYASIIIPPINVLEMIKNKVE